MAKISARGATQVLALEAERTLRLLPDSEPETWLYRLVVRSDGALLCRPVSRYSDGSYRSTSYSIVARFQREDISRPTADELVNLLTRWLGKRGYSNVRRSAR